MNHWVQGWIDWNIVLDRQGGPNWAQNWCVAPVIVDTQNDEVYYTPMFYVLQHFSKFIRPGATIIKSEATDKSLMVSAAENINGSLAIVIFNEAEESKSFLLELEDMQTLISIEPRSIQSILIDTLPR